MNERFVRADVARFFSEQSPVEDAWAMGGEVVRRVAGRETLKLCLDDRVFYLKRHRGVGWGELLKNWLVGKRPITGAGNEFLACRHLEQLGIPAPTIAAFGQTRGSPARRSSFVLSDGLLGFEDLEELTNKWLDDPPDPREKVRLIKQVAQFARRFHEGGIVHRDFYLCHLLKGDSDQLGVLDLHRALLFDELSDRWRQRDLAALLYSSLDLPLSERSWLRFVRIYRGRPLKEIFAEEGAFWRSVYKRALRLYDKGTRKGLTRGNFQR
jgi:heptose I phosphotransferase